MREQVLNIKSRHHHVFIFIFYGIYKLHDKIDENEKRFYRTIATAKRFEGTIGENWRENKWRGRGKMFRKYRIEETNIILCTSLQIRYASITAQLPFVCLFVYSFLCDRIASVIAFH